MSAATPSFFVEVDGASLWTIAFGPASAPAIVAVGGWTGSSELWLGPIGHLSGRYRCVTFDHRGTGVTRSDAASITHQLLVDDVIAVMDAHGIDTAVLAAESAGCAIALSVASRHPGRVEGLALVDALIPTAVPGDADSFVTALRSDYGATAAAFVDACAPPPATDAVRAWGRAILARSTAEHAIALLRADVPDPPLDARAVDVPALFIHCADDTIAPFDRARSMAATMPRATVRVLEGAEHVPTITRPAEIAGIIEAWLAALV